MGRSRQSRFGLLKLAAPALALALTGCMSPIPIAAFEAGRPELRPERFFMGETRGNGVLQTAGGRPSRTFQVVSRGRPAAGGGILVEQEISWNNGEVDRRSWTMRPVGPGRYEGRLSDAAGPVTAEARGNALRLRYLLRDPGVRMEQWLYLQPDGRTVLNEGTVRAFGIVVARLSEQIVRTEA